MAPSNKSKQKGPAANWRSPGTAEDLDPVQQLAHSIVSTRPDLLPSVERIMVASLETENRLEALSLFRTALTTPGDPNRDPRHAITQVGGEIAEA